MRSDHFPDKGRRRDLVIRPLLSLPVGSKVRRSAIASPRLRRGSCQLHMVFESRHPQETASDWLTGRSRNAGEWGRPFSPSGDHMMHSARELELPTIRSTAPTGTSCSKRRSQSPEMQLRENEIQATLQCEALHSSSGRSRHAIRIPPSVANQGRLSFGKITAQFLSNTFGADTMDLGSHGPNGRPGCGSIVYPKTRAETDGTQERAVCLLQTAAGGLRSRERSGREYRPGRDVVGESLFDRIV